MDSSKTSENEQRFIDAARNGRLKEVIELSSKFSNDVKLVSEALTWSCIRGHLDVVTWLEGHTAADVNYNEKIAWWNTPLTAACSYNNLNIVRYLVESCNADVNLPNRAGNTPLTSACSHVCGPESKYLLCEVSDLDVNIADSEGNTAMHLAVWCSEDDRTQLHEACIMGDVTEVRRLVYVNGHEINVQDNVGDTPLHRACRSGYSDIVEILMLAGADETITNDRGQTPAQLAVWIRRSELLKLLDRDSLWQVMLKRQNKSTLSLVVLMMLTVRLMKRKQMTGSWCHTFRVVNVILTMKGIINFNRTKRHKLKRNTNCII